MYDILFVNPQTNIDICRLLIEKGRGIRPSEALATCIKQGATFYLMSRMAIGKDKPEVLPRYFSI